MKLSVNIDHFATIREARKSDDPEPVLAALLAEQAGAEGIVCHIRSDRRHIKERDLYLLRQAIKTKLNVEMAATEEMKAIALDFKPDIVSLVPEKPEELTTEGGLDVMANIDLLKPHVKSLLESGIRVSIFVDPDLKQIEKCQTIGVDLIEINTGQYAEAINEATQKTALKKVADAARYGLGLGLEIHAGHGLDYRNIHPVAALSEITDFSIGFAIVARAAIVGIQQAVREMIELIS